LYLPQDLVDEFVDREDYIMYSYAPDMSRPEPATASASRKSSSGSASGSRTHVVRRGETLGGIAKKYGVSVKQLRSWNGLRGDQLRKGQRLSVSASSSGSSTKSAATTTSDAGKTTSDPSKKADYVYHTVQPGDTLWGIAQRYPGASVDEIRRLNSDMNLRKLVVGKKLKVAVQKG
jgi:LysM repeat protein